ncbi:unnamed protein product [Rotaria sp. Silwood2]|nr:unnamed protein product [Rotaria sp. Silwood2]
MNQSFSQNLMNDGYLAINARRKIKGNKPKFLKTSNQVLSSNDDNETNQVILTVKGRGCWYGCACVGMKSGMTV